MRPQLWPGGPGDGGSDLGQVSWSGECVWGGWAGGAGVSWRCLNKKENVK